MKKQIVRPSILPGFMELLASEQILFNQVRDVIKKNYECFGFIPMDTPIIEKSEILLAKGGGETEKQIYRFEKGRNDLSLRFDLTVPFARYVAQYNQDLNFPLRRYQIGKVFRGERNQKGRFREFYQCDIDIINRGDLNIVSDAELPNIIYLIFRELGLKDFTIYINNRKVLNGYFQYMGIENPVNVLRIIDKLDKVGEIVVKQELELLGMRMQMIEKLMKFIKIDGNNKEILKQLKDLNVENELFIEGLKELEDVVYYIKCFGIPEDFFNINLRITRGLDYYTGTVYETMLDNYRSIGSICSGGRYDDLAQNYTKEKFSGVGLSIGLTRLFYQLREMNLLKLDGKSAISNVIVVPMDKENVDDGIKLVNVLRNNKINSELYVEDVKLGKKLSYVNKSGITWAILMGDKEVENNQFTLKNMKTGKQENLKQEKLIEKLLTYVNNGL